MIDALLVKLLRRFERRTLTNHSHAIQVDRIELNHYWWAAGCESHQVILWRWSAAAGRYLAIRFFFVDGRGSDYPRRLPGGRWQFIPGSSGKQPQRVFETEDFIETVTAFDPWKRATDEGARV